MNGAVLIVSNGVQNSCEYSGNPYIFEVTPMVRPQQSIKLTTVNMASGAAVPSSFPML